MAVEGVRIRLGDRAPVRLHTLVHRGGIGAGDLDRGERHTVAFEDRTGDGACLTTERTAHHGLAPERPEQPGHPHALAARMDMDLLAARGRSFHRHREDRCRREDDDARSAGQRV